MSNDNHIATEQERANIGSLLAEVTQIQIAIHELAGEMIRDPGDEAEDIGKLIAVARLASQAGFLLDVCSEAAGHEAWAEVKEAWLLPHGFRAIAKAEGN